MNEKLHNNSLKQQIIQRQRWPLVIHCHENGTVAQSVEQRTFNPLVASSNLARPTIFNGYQGSVVRTDHILYGSYR